MLTINFIECDDDSTETILCNGGVEKRRENPVGQCWSMPKALITRKRFKPRTMGASAVAVAAAAGAAAVVAIGLD
ncbi:uncharacterized protein F4817DRAFT_314479 [Daldinia loculata]|uniref:uncharacterized protein n=1 Tax=Daldinia loculata TaxID=103429 RepID=UPI0020C33A1B|nr:uncharacterized protein F4817DRAFT_314479 [Daldinia loculata]KAI1648843.1 hypothetical protein F4817DRAFT_314479 [Daldinia loculata]